MPDKSNFIDTAMPHLDAVFRAAYALCRQRQDAEDLAQTTFAKAMERFGTFKPGTNCKAWLLRILRNTWFDQLRHRKVVGPEMPIDEGLMAGPDEPETTVWTDAADILENFSDEQVIRAMAELPDDQRLTLLLVDVEQLSGAEVGEIMDVAVGTVKSRTSRARSALKTKLQAHAEDLGLTERKR